MPIVLRTASTADRGFVRDLSAEAFRTYGDYRELLPGWLAEPGVLTLGGGQVAIRMRRPLLD